MSVSNPKRPFLSLDLNLPARNCMLWLVLRFRSKYHPEAFDKRQEEMQQALKVRCQTFLKLLELDLLSKARVDIDHSYDLVRVLDAGKSAYLECIVENP